MSLNAARQADQFHQHEVGDIIDDVLHARSPQELDALVSEVLDYYRFDYLCTVTRPRAEQRYSDNFILIGRPQAPPPGFSTTRLNTVLARVFRHARTDVGCLELRLHHHSEFDETAVDGNHQPDFGLRTPIACFFPVDSPKSGRGIVGYLGSREWVKAGETAELGYLANILFDRYFRLTPSPHLAKKLTKREYECLYWTAAGKTSAEIGTILSLSEHTINNYLVAACHKLDSVNRAHAVAKAIRQGIIS